MGLIMKVFNPFLDILPKVDVHGYNRDMMSYVLETFINDNLKLPLFASQSANPIGRNNILSLFQNFNKFKND